MKFDLRKANPVTPPLPDGYTLLPWEHNLLDLHANVKFESFCNEIDAHVFPSLAERDGCRMLMKEITRRGNFIPESTWLLSYSASPPAAIEFCGTIQGLQIHENEGSIQNVGVIPRHRGRGLANGLLVAALNGFREEGLDFASLEVTAQNRDAIQVYLRFGFKIIKPVFKSIEIFPTR